MVTLTMNQLSEKTGHSMGQRLRGRELGTIFRSALRQEISGHPRDSLLQFSLRDVSMMDVSFMDEVFGGIAEERGRGELQGAALILINVDPMDVDDIHRILAGRPAYSTGLRNCVLPLHQADEVRLLGKTEEYIAETFSQLAKTGKISASDLASQLNLALNTASTRLKTLYDLGIALRQAQESERGFAYHMLV